MTGRGFFVACLCALAQTSLLCYNFSIVLQSPAVQNLRETSKDRNGDTETDCGFSMVLRAGVAAFFPLSARRIIHGARNGEVV
jgi:hypothetical protein